MSLTFCVHQSFGALEQTLLLSQPPDRREKLQQAFQKLMQNVQPNLEPRNRETFTQNLAAFRYEIRQFILL